MSERICVIDGRREYERAQVCDADRLRYDRILEEIGVLFPRLGEAEPEPASEWTTRQDRRNPESAKPRWLREDPARDPGPNRPKWVAEAGHDPVSSAVPGGPISVGAGPRVTGSREAPVPVNLDRLDLTLRAPATATRDTMVQATRVNQVPVVRRYMKAVPVQQGDESVVYVPTTVEDRYVARQRVVIPGQVRPAGDQIGMVPVVVQLDWIARDWWQTGFQAEHMPKATVPDLVGWLRNRLEWACDVHPGIGATAVELKELIATMRRFLGLIDAEAEGMPSPCPGCDLLTLVRRPGCSDVECTNIDCYRILRPEEYELWCKEQAARTRRRAA